MGLSLEIWSRKLELQWRLMESLPRLSPVHRILRGEALDRTSTEAAKGLQEKDER